MLCGCECLRILVDGIQLCVHQITIVVPFVIRVPSVAEPCSRAASKANVSRHIATKYSCGERPIRCARRIISDHSAAPLSRAVSLRHSPS